MPSKEMLKVRLHRETVGDESQGVLVGFEVQGHADFGWHGTDIVCAGVSAIAQTALFGLRDVLDENVECAIGKGRLKVRIGADRAVREGPKAVLETFEAGLRAIGASYPGTVEIHESVCRGGE